MSVSEQSLLPSIGGVDNLQQIFGEMVRRRRNAAGLSQEALAAKAGLHRTYIGLLERGLRVPSIEVVRRLAEALDTTMTALIAELEGRLPGRSC